MGFLFEHRISGNYDIYNIKDNRYFKSFIFVALLLVSFFVSLLLAAPFKMPMFIFVSIILGVMLVVSSVVLGIEVLPMRWRKGYARMRGREVIEKGIMLRGDWEMKIRKP